MGKIGDWMSNKLSGIWSGVKDFGGKISGAASWIKDMAGKATSIPFIGPLIKKAYEIIPPTYRAIVETGVNAAEKLGSGIKSISPSIESGIGAVKNIIPFRKKVSSA